MFIFELKDNRLITDSEEKRKAGIYERIDQSNIPEGRPMKVWIKDIKFPVAIFRQVFTNKDGTHGERFLVSNDLTLTDEQFRTLYKKRWGGRRIS